METEKRTAWGILLLVVVAVIWGVIKDEPSAYDSAVTRDTYYSTYSP